ncbi:hypothetical protein LABALGNA3A7_05610 [Dellaglioa algida]|nr:hypothetical protein LABALGNA3A7_05610 [Dellaglioa algida]
MGALDFLKTKQFKQDILSLQNKNIELQKEVDIKLSITELSSLELSKNIEQKQTELSNLNNQTAEKSKEVSLLSSVVTGLNTDIDSLKQTLGLLEDNLAMQDFGIYEPHYDFATALGYKEQLTDLRREQKSMIKDKQAVSVNPNWTVDDSKAKGKKMNNNNTKAILRGFNNECEAAINKVTYSNLERIEKRIQTSFDQHNKMYEITSTRILPDYFDLKMEELYLAYEYSQKKQQEKEDLREQREKEREEKALKKEIENKQKVLNKEINHYKNVIIELQEKLLTADDSEKDSLNFQLSELQQQIDAHEKDKEALDYRLQNATAGYVYIISNIGSFGRDIVKIGVTRRLEPLDRIAELSSASVPYKFDVHALIFSYDAYQLESDLHHKFSDQRINKVNSRKEFFNIPIEDIETALTNYKDLTVDFEEVPVAEEYRESLAISSVK